MRFTSRSPHAFPAAACVAGLLLLIGWDASGLDLVVAQWFGNPHGFPLREHWLFSTVGMDPAGGLTWVLSIVGLVIVVRAALVPLMVKQIKSQRRMMEIAPEMKGCAAAIMRMWDSTDR